MSITYKVDNIKDLLISNEYAGRGIVIGKSADGKKAVFAYFIMGRSANSRNRIFSKTEDGIIIYPHKPELVEDPSLIIYSPVRKINGKTVVTNGDQTDTVVDFIKDGKTFEEALRTRCFEPDAPNLTPRISGMLEFENGFTWPQVYRAANAYWVFEKVVEDVVEDVVEIDEDDVPDVPDAFGYYG